MKLASPSSPWRLVPGAMENMDNNQKSSLRQKVTERLSGKIRTQSTLGYSIFKDKVLVEIALKPLSQQQLSNSHGFVPRQTLLSCFLQLPPELQLEILSYLDFGDIQRLRQTSRLFRESLDHEVMKSLFPRLFENMLKTCYICLTEGVEHLMIMGNARHQRYPLTSKCFSCIERQAGFMVGRRYTLVNSETVYVCRWCGIPVTSVMPSRGSDFHGYCYEWYKGALALHHAIGVAQWMVVIVGSALCWHYFIRQTMVTIPLALAFVIGFWPIILNMTRGHAMRTYHWSMITELVILTLWIPPMYAIINKAIVNRSTSGLHVSQPATSATLVFIVFNMIFRLANTIGHLILLCEWKMWQRSRPGISRLRRMAGRVLMVLVICADPQCFRQDYPGRWWFKRQRRFIV